MVRRRERRNLLLRPVDPEHFADAGIGARQRKDVLLAPRLKRRQTEHAVEFEQANERVDDVVARAHGGKLRTPGFGFLADFGTKQGAGLGGDLVEPRTEHLGQHRDIALPAGSAKDVGEVRTGPFRGDREQLDALLNAPSMGQFYNARIRGDASQGRYDCTRRTGSG